MNTMMLRATIALALAGWVCSGADTVQGNVYGRATAPIVVEVFSDFQCPACKFLHDNELPRLMQEYVIPGRVYLVYRYYPLPMHQYGRKAAEVVAAAAELGKYEQAATAAFARQQEWAETGKIEEVVDSVLTPAEQQKLKGLMTSPSVQQTIDRDVKEGQSVPVNGTPTLVVTYKQKRYTLGGAEVLKYEWIKAMLDDLLKR